MNVCMYACSERSKLYEEQCTLFKDVNVVIVKLIVCPAKKGEELSDCMAAVRKFPIVTALFLFPRLPSLLRSLNFRETRKNLLTYLLEEAKEELNISRVAQAEYLRFMARKLEWNSRFVKLCNSAMALIFCDVNDNQYAYFDFGKKVRRQCDICHKWLDKEKCSVSSKINLVDDKKLGKEFDQQWDYCVACVVSENENENGSNTRGARRFGGYRNTLEKVIREKVIREVQ